MKRALTVARIWPWPAGAGGGHQIGASKTITARSDAACGEKADAH